MTKLPRLNDLQLILLSAAARRDNGSLLPIPENIAGDGARVKTAVRALLKRQLVEEAVATDRSLAFVERDDEPIGVFITATGRAAIGAGAEPETGGANAVVPQAPEPQLRVTKTETVMDLLKRADGATLAELVQATGWLPHTTRAALTGLRKKGHALEKTRRDNATCYRIVEAG